MCGIAGLYRSASGPLTAELRDALPSMLGHIRHRGPNEAGMYFADRVAMGTMRLSIIGIQTGQQPMMDESGRFVLTYNGEIYNYLELRRELHELGLRFRTESDTEVVLNAWRAWGPRCLDRFNGGFAFAIHDLLEGTLHLARDRYGKRPLWIARHRGNVLFASEMKAFLGLEDFAFEFDDEQLASIFTLWTPVGGQSGFKGIEQVPCGAYASFRDNEFAIEHYHRNDFAAPLAFATERDALDAIRDALDDALEIRLRSDVEVGMYLSGGLDSSILAGLLAQKRQTFRTYSVAFEDPQFDESADQRRMAEHVGSRHQTLQVDAKMIVEAMPEAVFHAEVPVFRTAIVPMFLLSRLVRDDGIKVVITGEGADEAFLGYDLFRETQLRRAWPQLDDERKLEALRGLHPYLRHYTEAGAAQLLGLYQQFSQERHPGLFSHELRIQNGLFSRRLLRGQHDGLEPLRGLMRGDKMFGGLSDVQKAQWLEYQTLLPGYLLSSQGDRMALAHSVENRCPFLDPRIAEVSSAANLRFDDGSDEKLLLRKAFGHLLPPENLRKRKFPYRAPDAAAFVALRPQYLELLLSDQELRRVDPIDAAFSRRLLDKVVAAPEGAISTKENQAFVFLLSVALLHRFYVRREFAGVSRSAPIDDLLVQVIDHSSR